MRTNVFDKDASDPDIAVVSSEAHSHEADDQIIAHSKFLNEAKRALSTDPTRPIKRLYDDLVANAHRSASGQGGDDRPPILPEFLFVRSQMSRAKSSLLPPTPHHVEEVMFDGAWRTTWRGERFLLHLDNDWGIAIFSTRRNLTALVECQQLYMDATFRTAPQPYEQMFTVLGDYHGRVLPLAIALMNNRTIGAYRQVLQTLKRRVWRNTTQHWEPEAVMMDFEQALITAVETELPQTRVEGCYFHFSQSLWRHIQEVGLAHGYRHDERLQTLLRKVIALGFLPIALVRNNFTLLRHARDTVRLIRRYPSLIDFLTYVQNTYLDGNFPIQLWNVFEKDMDCRTNNNAEAFHRAWNSRVGVRHPNIWIFVRHLKDLQALTESSIRHMDRGGEPSRRARRWRLLENRLIRLKNQYMRGDRDLDNYWCAVSHLVHRY